MGFDKDSGTVRRARIRARRTGRRSGPTRSRFASPQRAAPPVELIVESIRMPDYIGWLATATFACSYFLETPGEAPPHSGAGRIAMNERRRANSRRHHCGQHDRSGASDIFVVPAGAGRGYGTFGGREPRATNQEGRIPAPRSLDLPHPILRLTVSDLPHPAAGKGS